MRQADPHFYKSQQWESCRASYMKKVGGICERCKARGLYVPAKIVHHKTHLTVENQNDPNISLSFDNLEALCMDCHNKEHFGMEPRRRFEVGPGGAIVPIVNKL